MRKFEYKVESQTNLHEQHLNRLGSEGWELVTVIVDSLHYPTYFLKREIPFNGNGSYSISTDDGYRGDPTDPRYKSRH